MKRVIALGFFDGVHLGHGALLKKTREQADALGCIAAALTFDRHPEEVIFGKKTPLLSTPQDRERIMKEQYGMDEVLVLPFDEHTMRIPWESFVKDVLIGEYGAVSVVCGHDFSFGHAGEGNAEKLCQVFGEHMPDPQGGAAQCSLYDLD